MQMLHISERLILIQFMGECCPFFLVQNHQESWGFSPYNEEPSNKTQNQTTKNKHYKIDVSCKCKLPIPEFRMSLQAGCHCCPSNIPVSSGLIMRYVEHWGKARRHVGASDAVEFMKSSQGGDSSTYAHHAGSGHAVPTPMPACVLAWALAWARTSCNQNPFILPIN